MSERGGLSETLGANSHWGSVAVPQCNPPTRSCQVSIPLCLFLLYTHVVSKRGVVLYVAATACTRVTTGYSIDLLFFLVSSVIGLKVIKVRKKKTRIVYHSTLPFMFCSDTIPMFAGFYCFISIRIAFSPFSHTYSPS